MTRRATPAAGGTVPVDGADLRWSRLGDGARTVIAAHQAPGGPSRPLWLRMLAETPGWSVLSLALRGTDGTLRPHDDLGDRWYRRWALDVARVAEALGETDYVYAGASHGALVAGGIQGRLCRPEDDLRAAAAVPGARLVLFQDHGHTTLLDEEPEPLIDQIRLFLAHHDPQSTPDHRPGTEEDSPCL